jgi:hypothetical protein
MRTYPKSINTGTYETGTGNGGGEGFGPLSKVAVHQIPNPKIPNDNESPITKRIKPILVIVFKNVPLKEDYLRRWIFGFCIPTREKAGFQSGDKK